MNFLATILLAFMAVGPLGARAMPNSEIADTYCVWEPCGNIPCATASSIIATQNCDLNGVTVTQTHTEHKIGMKTASFAR
ncbi:hypothetical protein BD769DRAFT_1452228 [Suillus cothurnatus]|nr:hypothetical protein BD769DRAFT_1452228 [Suillus cothurnatus]